MHSGVKKYTIIFLLIFVHGFSAFAIEKTGDTIIEKAALIMGEEQYGAMRFSSAINGKSFQQDAIVSHNGYQYVGYYDAERRVCLARRQLAESAWEIIRFSDHRLNVNDAHNTISLGICPKDGTIHLAFDHHGRQLNYRYSAKGAAMNPKSVNWAASLFSEIQAHLSGGKVPSVTYPRFFQTPEGNLQLCWRRNGSGNGDRMLADYDGEVGQWTGIRQIDSREGSYGDSHSRCSYPNGYTYGPKGRLHVTWVWREKATQTANHDLMYAYSNDQGKSWLNSDGELIEGVPALDSTGVTVVDIPESLGLMNTHGQAVDSKGRIHTVMRHCTVESLAEAGAKPGESRWGVAEARRYHHYWRDDFGVWQHRELPGIAGNRPKVLIDKADNVFLLFGRNPAEIAMEKGTYSNQADLIIMRATPGSYWKDWKIAAVEKGPFINEMLFDYYRWQKEGILSVMVQQAADENPFSSALRLIDFETK